MTNYFEWVGITNPWDIPSLHKKQFTWAFKDMAGIAVIKTNQTEATEQPSFALVPFNSLPVHNT